MTSTSRMHPSSPPRVDSPAMPHPLPVHPAAWAAALPQHILSIPCQRASPHVWLGPTMMVLPSPTTVIACFSCDSQSWGFIFVVTSVAVHWCLLQIYPHSICTGTCTAFVVQLGSLGRRPFSAAGARGSPSYLPRLRWSSPGCYGPSGLCLPPVGGVVLRLPYAFGVCARVAFFCHARPCCPPRPPGGGGGSHLARW